MPAHRTSRQLSTRPRLCEPVHHIMGSRAILASNVASVVVESDDEFSVGVHDQRQRMKTNVQERCKTSTAMLLIKWVQALTVDEPQRH